MAFLDQASSVPELWSAIPFRGRVSRLIQLCKTGRVFYEGLGSVVIAVGWQLVLRAPLIGVGRELLGDGGGVASPMVRGRLR